MIKNIAIGFVTGRKSFKNLLKTHINNWLEHGLVSDENICLHLFIVYDLKYQNTIEKDFKNIDPFLREKINSVTYIEDKKINKEIIELTANGKIKEQEAALIFGEGYAKKRNAVLYFAIKKEMDKLIFLDDDEYPMAVFKNDNNFISWMGQSIVGDHLKYNTDADITHGHHCGYISPIPAIKFDDILTEKDFKLFIETISNDIISWDVVKTNIIVNNGITYANTEIVENAIVKEVKEINGMKFISGANLCFNLKRFKKIPAFFNPPGARGEDTFMSTCLTDLKVLKIPSYAFHDGFSTNDHLLDGVLPLNFSPIDGNSPFIINRFVKAAIGWIRYKPLLIFITQRKNYEKIIKEMVSKLEITIPKLCKYFGTKQFEQLMRELKSYDKNVKKHFASFETTKNIWSKITETLQPDFKKV